MVTGTLVTKPRSVLFERNATSVLPFMRQNKQQGRRVSVSTIMPHPKALERAKREVYSISSRARHNTAHQSGTSSTTPVSDDTCSRYLRGYFGVLFFFRLMKLQAAVKRQSSGDETALLNRTEGHADQANGRVFLTYALGFEIVAYYCAWWEHCKQE
jgi:hypothetical protein